MNIFFIYKKSSDSILPLGFSKKFSFVCHKRKKILNQNAEIHYFEPIGELYEKAKTIFWNDKNIILNNYEWNQELETCFLIKKKQCNQVNICHFWTQIELKYW